MLTTKCARPWFRTKTNNGFLAAVLYYLDFSAIKTNMLELQSDFVNKKNKYFSIETVT